MPFLSSHALCFKRPPTAMNGPKVVCSFLLVLVLCLMGSAAAASCQSSCGGKTVSYPFALSPGCGHPDFQGLLTCNSGALNMTTQSGSYSVQSLNYSSRTVVISDSFLSNGRGCYKDISDRNFAVNSSGPLQLFNTVFLFTGCDSSKGPLLTGSRNYYCNFTSDACKAYEKCGAGPPLRFPGCCTHKANPVDSINLQALNCSSNGPTLGYTSVVNLSPGDNALNWVHGYQMQWDAVQTTSRQCATCAASNGVCGYDQSSKDFLCYCSAGLIQNATCPLGDSAPAPDTPGSPSQPLSPPSAGSPNSKKRASSVLPIVIGILVPLGILVGGLVGYLLWRRRRPADNGLEGKFEGFTLDDVVMEATLRFTYKELVAATNNFREELGKGGFGVVHKGVLVTGETVAVKQLQGSRQGEKEFRAEMAALGSIQHNNLVRLLGYCFEGSHKLLVYEYLVNGSLDKYIFRSGNPNKQLPALQWIQRFRIAVDATRGLHYLHEGCSRQIIHYGIKPANILLDSSFKAKVTDFGVTKLMDSDQGSLVSTLRGTHGYLPPEWTMGERFITQKSDVYSWGMVLLEMVGGRRNVEPDIADDAKMCYPEWVHQQLETGDIVELLDKDLQIERHMSRTVDLEQVKLVCRIALWCIQEDVSLRPTMRLVLQMLEGIVPVESPPFPYQSRSGLSSTSGDLWGEHSNTTSLSSVSFDSRTLVR